MTLFKDWFRGGNQAQDVPSRIYDEIMRHSLAPRFFGEGLAPDTFGGRFEVVAIHAVLIFRRLRNAGELGPSLAQDVFGELFSGFDDALREIGTGDLKVGKKIKDIASSFYGRAETYDSAMRQAKDGDTQELKAALERNIQVPSEGIERFAKYMLALDAALIGQSDESLMKGEISWPTQF